MNREKAQRRFIFVCLAPAVILATIFIFIPTINVFRMSLYRMGGITNKKSFVGFSNFIKLMDDKNFLEAMQNSILIIVMVMIFTIVFQFYLRHCCQEEILKERISSGLFSIYQIF